VLVEEEHAAGELAVSGLAGTLRVEGERRSNIRLELRGSERALEGLRREVRGGRLELSAPPGASGITSVISGRNNIVIATPGARATQIIGGVATTVGGPPDETSLEVRAFVPQGAPLEVEGMVGEVRVDGVGGPVELELLGGSAELDRTAGGRLAVVGGSNIAVGAASGDLAIEIRGAGGVAVDEAALDSLEVGISGSGDVSVGGSAQQASVAIAGVGSVTVDEVVERPRTRVTGIGRIDIGNW
jgi:hypothetical protein